MSPKKPIVYFRSFGADHLDMKVMSLLSKRKWSLRTYEELLKQAVKKAGPLVAIGKPGDKLPPLGAARMYLDDTNWHSRVKKLIEKAQMVFIHLAFLDRSDGLLWELGYTVENIQPEKLILCLPLTFRGEKPDNETYQIIREKSLSILPCCLPEKINDGQFIYFDQDWIPHILEPKKPKRLFSITGIAKNKVENYQTLVLQGLNRKFALAKTPLFLRHPAMLLLYLLILFFLLISR